MSDYVIAAERDGTLYALWSGNDGIPLATGTRQEIIDRLRANGESATDARKTLDTADRQGTSHRRLDGAWDQQMLYVGGSAFLLRDNLTAYLRAWQAGQTDAAEELLQLPGSPLTLRGYHELKDKEAEEVDADEEDLRDDGPIVLTGTTRTVSLPAAKAEVDLRILAGFRDYGTVNHIRRTTERDPSITTRTGLIYPEIELTTATGKRLVLRADSDPYVPSYDIWHLTTDQPFTLDDPRAASTVDLEDLGLTEEHTEELEAALDQLWAGVTTAWRTALSATLTDLAAEFTAVARLP
ncbi:hypothetical protein [Amycolatopsis anabasis]|uniref:hypothetical protein n=1 Tax=Amycolatopsis anabasis TaxID=1840409 RepID=UPI00131CB282|nr:hypothetical protein [Amycolatopsis anabasis]